jgi:hypothetical protein
MPDITDPDKIGFCDEDIRPAADLLAQVYNWANATLAEWNAMGGASWIPNTSDAIRDGANPLEGTGDRRHPITGADANNIMTRLSELVADFEANSSAKLNTVLAVAVNTTK